MANDNQRMPSVSVRGRTGNRAKRNPTHSFRVQQRPYEIQPVAIAPVLAGDSLRQARFEGRVLTQPVADPVTGWWSEMYLFYVRIGDMDEADAIRTFLLSSDEHPSQASLVTATNAWTYHTTGGPDWLAMAMKPIIKQYFRNEADSWNTHLLDGIPIAGLSQRTWLDTTWATADLPAGIADEDYEGRWEAYEDLRRQNLITMDFPEWLRSQGVKVPDQLVEGTEYHRKPELLRYVRQFAYPQNTVDPSDGGVAAAASWVISERCDKRIFCDQPGFLVLVSVVRPKVYRADQIGHGSSLLHNGRAWHSAVQTDAPQETLVTRETTTSTGPVDTTVNYTVDTNGLLTLGDQFLRGTGLPTVAVPSGASLALYPDETSIDGLFSNALNNYVDVDGTITFSITGKRMLDVTPR